MAKRVPTWRPGAIATGLIAVVCASGALAGCGGTGGSPSKAAADAVEACTTFGTMLQADANSRLSRPQLNQDLSNMQGEAMAADHQDPAKWRTFSSDVDDLVSSIGGQGHNGGVVLDISTQCKALTQTQ